MYSAYNLNIFFTLFFSMADYLIMHLRKIIEYPKKCSYCVEMFMAILHNPGVRKRI